MSAVPDEMGGWFESEEEKRKRIASEDPEIAAMLQAQADLEARIKARIEEALRPKWSDEKHLPELHEMMSHLARNDPDGAREINGVGFAKFDVQRGHKLAGMDWHGWSDWDKVWAFERMTKYRKQLEAAGFNLALVPLAPPTPLRPEPVKETQWDQENGWVICHFEHLPSYDYSEVRYGAHRVPGFRFEGGNTLRFPANDKHAAKTVPGFLEKYEFPVPDGLLDHFAEVIRKAELVIKLSRATDLASVGITDFIVPERLGGTLRPFQAAGVAYVAEIKKRYDQGVLIADEMGLGKTIEALAAAEYLFTEEDWKHGLLVVVPPSLALKWYRECVKWLPHRKTSVLDGGKAQSLAGNIIICPYSILRYVKTMRGENEVEEENEILWMLKQRPWAGTVFDEFHYIKNESSMRSRAVLELIATVKPHFRLGLTGSPVINRAVELAPQLEALDIIRHWGTSWTFEREAIGNPLEVHEKLRELGFLRREKVDVLKDLPAKQRDVVPVDMSGKDWKEYRYMEAEFKKWLRENLNVDEDPDGFAKYMRAMRAEVLVKIEKLSYKVAQGKLPAVIENAKGFLNDSDQKLIIFAHHIDIQRDLVTAFGDYGVAWLAGTSVMDRREQDAQVGRFQEDPECRVIVCSAIAGQHGHDLFAASNVMMMELNWGPEPHNQMEDRAHRIGQKAAVNAHFMLTPQTIDDYRMALIDSKRKITAALNRGIKVEEDELLATMLQNFLDSKAPDADTIVKEAVPDVWNKLMTGELKPDEEAE